MYLKTYKTINFPIVVSTYPINYDSDPSSSQTSKRQSYFVSK